MGTERPQVQPDSFGEFRTSREDDGFVPWESWRPQVTKFFPENKIPEEVEVHLREWYTLRNRVRIYLIPREKFATLRVNFSEEHSALFEMNNAAQAIRHITEKFPLAG